MDKTRHPRQKGSDSRLSRTSLALDLSIASPRGPQNKERSERRGNYYYTKNLETNHSLAIPRRSEPLSCTIRLHQHLVLFDGMKAGVSVMIHLQRIRVNNIEIVGASSLRESSASTRHSNFLQVLTLMTVVSTCISSGALL